LKNKFHEDEDFCREITNQKMKIMYIWYTLLAVFQPQLLTKISYLNSAEVLTSFQC